MSADRIRKLLPNDFDQISSVVDEWWDGRPVRSMVPRLFFEHFNSTSLAIGDPGKVVGFLIGFVSPSNPESAYIHFVGVNPSRRGQGLARSMYETFFCNVAALGCKEIRCVTSPMNRGSIAFHIRMGFELSLGNGEVGGVPVFLHYAAPGEHRVLFKKVLGKVAQST
jgi:ribosomal protein S18 acetylase RimI-like enzyme